MSLPKHDRNNSRTWFNYKSHMAKPSKYMPHQGKREKTRRIGQILNGDHGGLHYPPNYSFAHNSNGQSTSAMFSGC